MRVGTCPERVKFGHNHFPRVTVCVLVCVPHQLDYFADRFEVLKLSLASLRQHTARSDYNLLVFDNGSCAEVAAYLRTLQAEGAMDHLMVSARNIGKIAACRMMFAAAPGEVIAYGDDDVWYGAGWLDAQLRVLDGFPRVGLVSARPVRRQFHYGNGYLASYLDEFADVTAERGTLIPTEWEREYLRSTGHAEADAEVIAAQFTDIRLSRRDVQAFSTANHFQFIAPKALILAALDKRDQPRTGSEERQFEEALDAMGYARLSTVGRHVRHIGNVISDELREEASASGVVSNARAYRPASPLIAQLSRLRLLRGLLARLNRWSYLVLNQPPV